MSDPFARVEEPYAPDDNSVMARLTRLEARVAMLEQRAPQLALPAPGLDREAA